MAASFAITAHTAESLTVTVSGVEVGDVVTFYLRREDDTDTTLYIVAYTATSTTCVKTFPPPTPGDELAIYECEYLYNGVIPLYPNTAYAVNVKINDGDHLGIQYATTDYTDHIVDIPILPSDFALFDWADWPDSKAALVSGGYTHNFQKECWNAIVDRLAKALDAAGIQWDSLYAPVSATRITQAYGDLYAAVFNSVRHNIDSPMPFGWQWANNPDFRGYVGREDFRGVDPYGESGADDVYAEYILELVRKLNVLIQVMRAGDIVAYVSGHGQASVGYDESFRLGKSASFSYRKAFDLSNSEAQIRAGRAAMIIPYDASVQIGSSAMLRRGSSEILRSTVKNLTRSALLIEKASSAPIKIDETVTGKSRALIFPGIPRFISAGADVSVDSNTTIRSDSGILVNGHTEAEAAGSAAVQPCGSIPINAGAAGAAKGTANVEPHPSCRVKTETQANAKGTAAIRPDVAGRIVGKQAVAATAAVKVDIAWYPPIWINGGLWIRQSHNVTQNENGELVIT